MKENNLLGGFFTEISQKNNSIDGFIQDTMLYPKSTTLTKYLNMFKKTKKEIQPQLEKLANIEILIQQHKAINDIRNNVKFSVIRNTYIYARTPFYDLKNDTIDIRVIVGKLLDYPDYQNNPDFINAAIEKLTAKAIEEYSNTTDEFNKLYETKKKNEIRNKVNG